MKKILITGENSYVGNAFEKWLMNYPGKYAIDKISMRDESWRERDFSTYDVVLHVAGIAHVSSEPEMEELYYKVNRDLTIEAAKKAKAEGVKQFIFMSSIIVYGEGSTNKKVIDRDTIPNPSNFYGNSKLQAEDGIKDLENDDFRIVIIRPPMIYGKDSKGNYPKLAKAARKLPIFPDIDNERSMLHIDNLSEFIRLMIENEENGFFFPQNREYVRTSEMVRMIAEVHEKDIKMVKLFNPVLRLLLNKIGILNKVFGNLVYDKKMSCYFKDYQIRNLGESIVRTERNFKPNYNIDVLLMSDNALESVGGEQESTKIIINGVKDRFTVGVIQPGNISKPAAGVHYFPLTTQTRIKHLIKNPLSFINYMWKVKKVVSEENPQVIHTQAQVSFFIIALLRKLKLIPNTFKFIHTERGLYTKYSINIKRIFHFFLKELDVLVTTTEFNMEHWKDALKRRGLSISLKVIENTAGELFESYDSNYRMENKDQLVLGFSGRYTEWKNWPLAIEISKKLNEILGEKLRVNMAVGCLDKDSEKRTNEMFKELSGTLGSRFKGRINIDITEMNRFYYSIDVFILTSNFNTESFGRTLVEAMSRRTVVLTTNAGGSVEVVANPDNVCDTGDMFVKRVLEFNDSDSLMKKEKEHNLVRVKEKYSLDNNLKKHIQLYNDVLD